MEATIEIKRYFDDEDIKDIVEDEIRGYVRGMVREYFDFNNYCDFVAKVASDVFKDCMDELDGDMIHDIQEKVRASIKDIGVYNLIGTNYSWRKGVEEKTEVQKIIDDVSLYRGLFGRPIPDNASTEEYRNEILARIIDLCDVSEKEE